MSERTFLFICGCPRSGTSALCDLINVHPDACIGMERYFNTILNEGRLEPSMFETDHFLNYTEGQSFWPELPRSAEMHKKFAGAACVGEKLPRLYERLDLVESNFPRGRTRVIFISRDPLAVASSYNRRARDLDDKNWGREQDWHAAVNDYNESAKAYSVYKDRVNIMHVSYESLFNAPNEGSFSSTINAITDFVGLSPFGGESLEIARRRFLYNARRKVSEVSHLSLNEAAGVLAQSGVAAHAYGYRPQQLILNVSHGDLNCPKWVVDVYRNTPPCYESVVAGLISESPRGGVFVDCGAHTGTHTTPMVNRGDVARVYAIEAVPGLCDLLRGKFSESHKFRLAQCAVAGCAGELSFSVAQDALGYSGVKQRDLKEVSSWRTILVQAARLDQIVDAEDHDRVGLIKLDLEGGEFDALFGGYEVLKRSRPVIIFENGLARSAELYWYSSVDFLGFFDSIGFLVFDFFGRRVGTEYWNRPLTTYMFVALPQEIAEYYVENVLLQTVVRVASKSIGQARS